ncbi:SE1561 family protein [Alkalihalobacillus trypoxylicola]|uniref:Uncharacterized protein n=1 Tax=Alkalihalobacillus trypoxylicola TaxID=519424 RepID=A0A161P7E7_9BACI|nr:SE1561 family protein [Alkalihalobacillus trypoxylicola]KYG27001.1 hypothetical protein AZF04_11745 [Alkalihalobacillus trypoxylicola]GAF67128.1 hypothetical protein BTS2_4037 [Bacillus sp. TS-2]
MGGAVHDKSEQKNYLQARFEMVLTMLESINPEEAGVEEIDRLIDMLDDIENKCKQFRHDWKE